MNKLGNSLVFYLKHFSAMEYLWEDVEAPSEIPEVKCLSGIENLYDKLELISDVADVEEKDFRNQISKVFENNLNQFFEFEKVKRQGWFMIEYNLWEKNKKRPIKRLMTIGLNCIGWNTDNYQFVIWVWSSNGKKSGDLLSKSFGASDLKNQIGWTESGTHVFELISLPKFNSSLDIEVQPILESIDKTLKKIPMETLQTVYKNIQKINLK